MAQQWYHNWFNSNYYHLLYSERDGREAEYFIDNLCAYLKPPPAARMLDIACGRGRHAVYLNKKGYDVTGIDLSIASIAYAKPFENSRLRFFVHDMRSLYYNNCFDVAFNLFTSFGYFENDDEHINALKTFNRALKPGGLFVMDFFNSKKVLKNLVAESVKTVDGIDFYIKKRLEGDKIIKDIKFDDKGRHVYFKEMVTAFTFNELSRFFKLSGFEIIAYFGNYSLDDFDPDNSDRLIFICRKTHA